MSETPVNFYGGSPLNRLSWLRTSQAFLNTIVALPSAKWLLWNAGQPLTSTGSGKPAPIFLSIDDVAPLLGPAPYFGQGQEPGSHIVEHGAGEEHTDADHSPTAAARHLGVRVVFLGLFEKRAEDSTTALPTSELSNPQEALKKLDGTPYCALDVMDLEYTPEQMQAFLDGTTPGREGTQLAWAEPRALMSSLDASLAAIFANARSMTDWNQRNKFCAGCGTKTYSMWGGWKIACRSLLPWADNTGKKPCPTVKGLHNFTHPRTDAVVIMIAIDQTGEKILLGRNRKFPGKFYSALAGFIEPGESFEDAVAREMWEEAGVHVWNIKYHSGQPWPFPANLMVGFYARADSTKPIRTDLDNELVDARWYTREEILAVLNHKTGTRFAGRDYKKLSEIVDGPSTEQKPIPGDNAAHVLAPPDPRTPNEVPKPVETVSQDEPAFRVPPTSAIAGVLIRDWAERRIGFPPEESVQKGNL